MIKRFLFSKLPKSIAQKASKSITTPQSARIFCSGYASCSDSLSKNSVEALIANPYLWQPEECCYNEKQISKTISNYIINLRQL